ncbi:MAG: sigma-70 family RNA polymerase sigma factor [Armatimonadaceae bacterium]|jgi:RNA polymerase sigma-70 factor (ECF subfamily)
MSDWETPPGDQAGADADLDRDLDFQQLHLKYQGRVYNLILRMVGDPDEAMDLTQETFANAWRAWGRFRGDSRVFTWLYQIAYNNCKNWYKARQRRRERESVSLDHPVDAEGGGVSREIPDWDAAPEQMLLDKEMQEQIRRAVDALPAEYRDILVLAQWEDLPYEEIARITGLTIPAVKTRLHRARQKVRQRIEPYYRGWMGRSE